MPKVPAPKRHPYAQWSPDARALDLVGDKWTLLIVRDLATGPRRFVELQRVLPGISTEQLRSRLNRMVADELLTRQRYREVPPRVEYELTERGRELLPVLGELARWGYRWSWGQPATDELIDVCAIFRLASGLVEPVAAAPEVELTVTDHQPDAAAIYAIRLGPDQVRLFERGSAEPAATVAGTTAGWVRALSPEADHSALQIDGDAELAQRLVTQLSQQ
jgi:DNA-binding HxlR family transcriptional regulator